LGREGEVFLRDASPLYAGYSPFRGWGYFTGNLEKVIRAAVWEKITKK